MTATQGSMFGHAEDKPDQSRSACGHASVLFRDGACQYPGCINGKRDMAEARRTTDAAVAQSDENADDTWRESALASVRHIAEKTARFVSDDVRDYLVTTYPEHSTHNMSALGAIMREAAKRGWIERTSEFARSDRVVSHRDLRPVWRSLIFGNV